MTRRLLLSLASLAFCAPALAADPINETAACVIARQLAPDGSVMAANRVCANLKEEAAIFPQRMMGERAGHSRFGPTALTEATIRMTGLLSRFERADGRDVRIRITEKGPVKETRSLTVALSLEAGRSTRVALPSGSTLTLEMDHSTVPNTFDQALGASAGPETQHGAQHGAHHGAQHGAHHGAQHGAHHGAQHGAEHGAEHGTRSHRPHPHGTLDKTFN